MDNIKRYNIITNFHKVEDLIKESNSGRFVEYDKAESTIKDLTDKLVKSNKGYCPERIGYEVHYKYIHNNCNGLDCDKCVRDQIEKGLTDVGSNKETK